MNILGISALYHDSAAAICSDGKIVAAAQEERFSRVKHDKSLPARAMDYCLEEANLAPDALDAVVYYDNPLLTLDRWLTNCAFLGENSDTIIQKGFASYYGEKLWIHHLIRDHLASLGKHGKLLVCDHHISHAASAFYPSPYETAAILTIDGVGEWATATIGRGNGMSCEIIQQLNYPHSLGLLYSAFTHYCGFGINSGEYKLMGLAPYGEPRFHNVIRDNLIEIKQDGSFRLNLEYFAYHREDRTYGTKFESLFGGPRRIPEAPITKREIDLAASIQQIVNDVVLKMAIHAKALTGYHNLCMAGGVALNCVTNGYLLNKRIFENIWIQPAAGDAGGAIGAALFASHHFFGIPRKKEAGDIQCGTRLGPSWTNEKILQSLIKEGIVHTSYANRRDALCAQISERLYHGDVVALFDGRMEFGPRALGARSILANATRTDTQSRLNLKVKRRESFRPFAPVVLNEFISDYFDLDTESRYMLFVVPVRVDRRISFDLSHYMRTEHPNLYAAVNQARSSIPAVTHVDYSARVQTVGKEEDCLLRDILLSYHARTQCPVLANTSFNIRGEPIVCSPDDAIACFMNTDIDALVIGDFLIVKTEQQSRSNLAPNSSDDVQTNTQDNPIQWTDEMDHIQHLCCTISDHYDVTQYFSSEPQDTYYVVPHQTSSAGIWDYDFDTPINLINLLMHFWKSRNRDSMVQFSTISAIAAFKNKPSSATPCKHTGIPAFIYNF